MTCHVDMTVSGVMSGAYIYAGIAQALLSRHTGRGRLRRRTPERLSTLREESVIQPGNMIASNSCERGSIQVLQSECSKKSSTESPGSSLQKTDLKDSAADFDTVLAAANLKINIGCAADTAAFVSYDYADDKPVVITFLPCCNETKEELSNPLSLINNPDADTKLLLERISMRFYIVVDGQHDDAPETSILKALKEILNIDEEQDQPTIDRGCKMYHLFRNGFEVFVYIKGRHMIFGQKSGCLCCFTCRPAESCCKCR